MACREHAEQDRLTRFAKLPGGEIVPDPERRLAGRGAYLHPTPRCEETARKRRSLERALGGSTSRAWVNSGVLT